MNKIHSKQKGIGLIEVVISVVIITLAFLGFLALTKFSLKIQWQNENQTKALNLAKEAMEAIRNFRNENWNNFAALTAETNYYPVSSSGKWILTASNPGLLEGRYNRWLIINNVYRDASDNISASGALDPNTKKVTAYVQWTETSGSQQISLTTYLTNWK